MCARYTLAREIAEVVRMIVCVNLLKAYTPRYNIAPGQGTPVIVREEQVNELRMLRWGLVPAWAQDEAIGRRLINARMETLMEKPAFRGAWKSRRCLIPADGFFEWLATPERKIPYYFGTKDGQPFCFAGLWERWQPAAGLQRDLFVAAQDVPPLETFTIITTVANELMSDMHDRMPVIVEPKDYELWLAPATHTQKLANILRPLDAAKMWRKRISTYVNSSRVEGPECIVEATN